MKNHWMHRYDYRWTRGLIGNTVTKNQEKVGILTDAYLSPEGALFEVNGERQEPNCGLWVSMTEGWTGDFYDPIDEEKIIHKDTANLSSQSS